MHSLKDTQNIQFHISNTVGDKLIRKMTFIFWWGTGKQVFGFEHPVNFIGETGVNTKF